jgi:hypothetical protein
VSELKKTVHFALIIALVLLLLIIVSTLTGCALPRTVEDTLNDSNIAIADNQERLESNQPAPKLDFSLERDNQINRSKIINDKNRLGYLYLLSDDGKVVDFVVIKGKVSSTKSYLVPDETFIKHSYGNLTIQAPDIDGSYGENQDAIYFFEPDGNMGEWNKGYRYSTKPLKMTTQPILIRETP